VFVCLLYVFKKEPREKITTEEKEGEKLRNFTF
jgi:hypothetical protein